MKTKYGVLDAHGFWFAGRVQPRTDSPDRSQVEICKEWIARQPRRVSVYRRRNSYGYKHDVERDTGKYIANGALLAAAIESGLVVQRLPGIDASVNAWLNIGRRRHGR